MDWPESVINPGQSRPSLNERSVMPFSSLSATHQVWVGGLVKYGGQGWVWVDLKFNLTLKFICRLGYFNIEILLP